MPIQLVARVSAAIAALACLLLFADQQLGARVSRPLRVGIAALLLVAGIATHFHFFSISAYRFVHRWEMFHYVLGAKYAQELEYERLYTCVAVADAESGHADEVRQRSMRDLRDDRLMTGAAALALPADCIAHFSGARWASFKADVGFFRRASGSPAQWAAMQEDHGYNPSPVWTLTGHALASIEPLNHALLLKLACLDLGLLAVAFASLCWAFGPRVGFLAALFWSTQAPSNFMWMGGAFLRQDWLLLAVASVAFARKRRFFAAGFCLAWSALLRVFPVLLLLGALLPIGASLVRRRSLERSHARFLVGAAGACCLLLTATTLSGARVDTYMQFADHLYMHAQTPIANHMSLRSLLSFAPESRFAEIVRDSNAPRPEAWDDARRRVLARRGPWLFLTSGLLLLWTGRCLVRLHTLWIAISVSLLLIMILSDPSSYYFSVFVLAAVLARARAMIGVMLMGVAAAGQMLSMRLSQSDDGFAAMSALYLVFACVLVWLFSRPFRWPQVLRTRRRETP